MRKHITLSIAFALVLVISGCQQELPAPPVEVAPTSVPVLPDATSPSVPLPLSTLPPQPNLKISDLPGPAETVTITFAEWRVRAPIYEELIKQFQEIYPTIDVKFVPYEQSWIWDYNAQRMSALADVAIAGSELEPEDILFLHDLTPLADADTHFDRGDFIPAALRGCQLNDTHLIGLPIMVGFNHIAYDGAAFDAAGIERPQPGWSIEDFQRAALQLTQREGNRTTRYGLMIQQQIELLAPHIEASLAHTGARLDPIAVSDALNWYQTLIREGAIKVLDITNDQGRRDTIIDRQTAMWISFPLELDGWRDSLGDDVHLVPFPIDPDLHEAIPATLFCAVMSSSTQHPNEAWLWLNFLTYRFLDTYYSWIPARYSVADAIDFWDGIPEHIRPALQFSLEHGWYGPTLTEDSQKINETLKKAYNEGLDFATAFEPLRGMSFSRAVEPLRPGTGEVTVPQAPTAQVSTASMRIRYFPHPLIHPIDDTIRTLAQQFNDTHPDIAVTTSLQVAPSPGGLTFSDIAAQYDCFASNSVPPHALNQIYNLDPLIESNAIAIFNDIHPDWIEPFRYQGQIYALPANVQPTVLYYNADLLAAHGLSAPQADWTLDDFVALADAVASGADDVYGFVPFQGNIIEFLFATQNVPFNDLNLDPSALRLDDPDVIAVTNWLTGLVDAGIMPAYDRGGTRSTNGNLSTRRQLITSGQTAFWTDLAGLNSAFGFGQEPPFTIGIAPLPRVPGALPLPVLGGMYISRFAQHPEACWEWIKFLSDQPSAFIAAPARLSILGSPEWEAITGEETATALRNTLTQSARSITTLDDNIALTAQPIKNWLYDAFVQAFAGEDSAIVLRAAQQKVDAYLDCIGPPGTVNANQTYACAKDADPNYKTPQELNAAP